MLFPDVPQISVLGPLHIANMFLETLEILTLLDMQMTILLMHTHQIYKIC